MKEMENNELGIRILKLEIYKLKAEQVKHIITKMQDLVPRTAEQIVTGKIKKLEQERQCYNQLIRLLKQNKLKAIFSEDSNDMIIKKSDMK